MKKVFAMTIWLIVACAMMGFPPAIAKSFSMIVWGVDPSASTTHSDSFVVAVFVAIAFGGMYLAARLRPVALVTIPFVAMLSTVAFSIVTIVQYATEFETDAGFLLAVLYNSFVTGLMPGLMTGATGYFIGRTAFQQNRLMTGSGSDSRKVIKNIQNMTYSDDPPLAS